MSFDVCILSGISTFVIFIKTIPKLLPTNQDKFGLQRFFTPKNKNDFTILRNYLVFLLLKHYDAMYMYNVQCVIQCVFCTNKERQPAHHKHTDISITSISCDRYMETRAWYLEWTMTKAFTSLACFLVNVHKRRLLFTEVNTETLKCCNHKSFECDDITFIQQHYVVCALYTM